MMCTKPCTTCNSENRAVIIDINFCTGVCHDFLDNAAAYVRPGGTLVYSTCTVLKEENEAVVEAFLKDHPDFALAPFDLPGIGRVEDGMLTLWPHVHGTDGFFMAKIVKVRG